MIYRPRQPGWNRYLPHVTPGAPRRRDGQGTDASAHSHRVGVTFSIRRTGSPPRHRDLAHYVSRIDRGVTIVTVQGDIDAHNAHGLLSNVKCRNATGEGALLLDLTGLGFFSTHGLRALDALDQRCHFAALPWITVPSPAVSQLLRISKTQSEIPTAESLPAALGILHNARRR